MAVHLKNAVIHHLPIRQYGCNLKSNMRFLVPQNSLTQVFLWKNIIRQNSTISKHLTRTASQIKHMNFNLNEFELCLMNRTGFQQKRTICQTAALRQWGIEDQLSNPLTALNEFTVDPILPVKDQLFSPEEKDLLKSKKFFQEHKGNTKTLKGVVDLKDLPILEHPEVAFLGRSNVGKSSLIKTIFNDPSVKVSVSKKPGHTRVLKFYHVEKLFSLVDMPGYGHNMPEYFVESMEEYLKSRKQLTKVFLLIDGKVGLLSADEIAIDMMEEFSRPYVIVFTKIDKTTPSRVVNHVLDIRRRKRRDMVCCFPQPFLTSSTHGWGIPMLQSFITYITGAQYLESVS